MLSHDEIFNRVASTLEEALNVDRADITPEASLKADLNAESIDFLDIVFRLEREFNIKIPRNELFPDAIIQGDEEFVQDGHLTERGVEELKDKMPFADVSKISTEPDLETLMNDLFTVDLIAKYIAGKVAEQPTA